jgi:hypothetical protein
MTGASINAPSCLAVPKRKGPPVHPGGPFRLTDDPASKAAIRKTSQTSEIAKKTVFRAMESQPHREPLM